MPRYVVASLSLFDNDNQLYVVDAENEVAALRIMLPYTTGTTIEDVLQAGYDADLCVSKPLQVGDDIPLRLPPAPTESDEDDEDDLDLDETSRD